jgi:hypothetical protein
MSLANGMSDLSRVIERILSDAPDANLPEV